MTWRTTFWQDSKRYLNWVTHFTILRRQHLAIQTSVEIVKVLRNRESRVKSHQKALLSCLVDILRINKDCVWLLTVYASITFVNPIRHYIFDSLILSVWIFAENPYILNKLYAPWLFYFQMAIVDIRMDQPRLQATLIIVTLHLTITVNINMALALSWPKNSTRERLRSIIEWFSWTRSGKLNRRFLFISISFPSPLRAIQKTYRKPCQQLHTA